MDQNTPVTIATVVCVLEIYAIALHFKWCFQGVVIWGGKKSSVTSVRNYY